MSGQNKTLFEFSQTSTYKRSVIARSDFNAAGPAWRMQARRAICMIVLQQFSGASQCGVQVF
jgi:hypothetical protein